MRANWVVAMVAAAACSGGGPAEPKTHPPVDPVPGWVNIRLDDGYADDAALVLRVAGPKIVGVGRTGAESRGVVLPDSNNAVVYIRNPLIGQILFSVHVPDLRIYAYYGVSRVESAERGTYRQRVLHAFEPPLHYTFTVLRGASDIPEPKR